MFVKKHEHSLLFDQAFEIFWKRKGLLEKLIAMMSPQAPSPPRSARRPRRARAASPTRCSRTRATTTRPPPSLDLDARFTMSDAEILQTKDFAQMSAAEIARAREAIARLVMPDDLGGRAAISPTAQGRRIDPRRCFRRSLRGGGAIIDLAFRAPARAPSADRRALRHLRLDERLHARCSCISCTRSARSGAVTTFLFGTRLTNVTRALRARDPDEALALCSGQVRDWSGGTRIGASLRRFNREWARRVLGQGAIVLLFTDGLEREAPGALGLEMERLRKSCRRLIWVNPLLRFDGFAAKALGHARDAAASSTNSARSTISPAWPTSAAPSPATPRAPIPRPGCGARPDATGVAALAHGARSAMFDGDFGARSRRFP